MAGVNVEPLVMFAQAFVPGMAEGHWGRIVSTGSSVTLSQQQHDLVYVTSKGSGPSVDEVVKLVVSQQTIKRPCTLTDVANALSFLVSDDAAFITGQILYADGGFSRSGA